MLLYAVFWKQGVACHRVVALIARLVAGNSIPQVGHQDTPEVPTVLQASKGGD